MVKFGERLLNGLMRPGWEHAYLDYEKLKTIIDGIKMETAQTGSEAFLVAFTSEIAKVDSFVSEHLVNLKRTLSPDASAAILRNVEADINNVVSCARLMGQRFSFSAPTVCRSLSIPAAHARPIEFRLSVTSSARTSLPRPKLPRSTISTSQRTCRSE